jgi:hypothetical protein
MSNSKITPEKVTNPMQLMAAWFVMLSTLVGILLTAAAQITEPAWITPYLVISSTVLILAVIACVLLMLIKYRPHLQDGENYSVWLKDTLQYTISPVPVDERSKTVELSLEVGKNIEEKIDFLKKARLCNIEVLNADGAEKIVYALNRDGYSARLHAQPQQDGSFLHEVENATGIWVGENLDVDVVLRAIYLSRQLWPQLKYLYLPHDANGPGYMSDQIFIGGSASAVKRMNLKSWTNEELEAIDNNITVETFHSLIRNKYSTNFLN